VRSGRAGVSLHGDSSQVVSIVGRRNTTVGELFRDRLAELERDIPDLVELEDPVRTILGPSIGYEDGVGAVFCGTISTSQGWNARVDVVLLAARVGRLAAAFSLVTDSCGTSPTDAVFMEADTLLNTFAWSARERPRQ
jgi:hypothetical protein